MTLPPDKLFQQRLEKYSKNPPVQAWERIEAGLNKKKPNRVWMMIAASLLVVIVAATMIYDKSQYATDVTKANDEPTQILPEKNIIPGSEKQSVTAIDSQEFAQLTQSRKIFEQNIAESSSTNFKTTSLIKQVSVNKPEENLTSELASDEITHSAKNEMATEESNSVPEPETSLTIMTDVAGNEAKPAGRKLTYSASDVHARFLKEKQSITLSPNEKPETGLEKIFDLTYSLKSGETSLGHLRRLKNDFISNAFSHQKSKKQ